MEPKLHVSFDICIDAGTISCPHLILQPLVENAVIHGAAQTPGDFYIKITAAGTRDGFIEVSVEDNGPGIEHSKLLLIRSVLREEHPVMNSKNGNGYALYNVCKRLHYYYNEDAGINIESTYGQGAKVTLRFRASKKEGW